MNKKSFMKKVTALGLCGVLLASQPAFAREGTIKDSYGNKLGDTYEAIGEHIVDAYTCSVKNANGQYTYKSQVKVHVYLVVDGQHVTEDLSKTTVAKSTTYATIGKKYKPYQTVQTAAFTHIIWQSGKQYSQVYNL